MGQALTLTPRTTKESITELVAPDALREVWKNADSLSGSALERVVIGGEPFVLKHLHVDDDWIQRVQGDLVTRPLVMWRAGLFDALPGCIEHTIVDIAAGLGRNGWGAAVLMRDVSEFMVQVSGGPIPLEEHLRFLDHMAALHAHFWGFTDDIGLMPMSNRYFLMSKEMSSYEAVRRTGGVPSMVEGWWERLSDVSPSFAKVLLGLVDAPWALIEAQQSGPQTLVHSDWKAGNLGSLPDGRTVVLDWAFPGQAPPTVDLAWYIAVNCDLLPQSKDDAIDAYREALEGHGIDTSGWWDAQLELALLGATMLQGCTKSGDELAWWEDRIPRALRYLD